VKTVTVSLPEAVYRKARIKAAERGTSLHALVREFLISIGEESDFARRKRLQDDVLGSLTLEIPRY
jgi:plasmid stability protein